MLVFCLLFYSPHCLYPASGVPAARASRSLIVQVLCWVVFGSKSAPRVAKSDSKLLFLAPRASKSAPRGRQEAFRGLPRRRCVSGSFLDPFLAPKSEPGTSKLIKILATVGDLSGFAIFSLDRFRTSFLDPPGLLLGGYLAPRQAKNGLLGGLGPSKSRSPITFLGPGGVQERSKRPTGG